MKIFKNFALFCMLACLPVLSGCDELCMICDDDEKEIIIKEKGLPMSGDQEVPVRETDAHGTIDVWYNKHTNMLAFKIAWHDLTGDPVGSHIHGTAPKGVNAGIKYDFTSALPKSTSGTFSDSFKIDDAGIDEDSLLNGLYYINIHTPTYPGGEIRGQIEFH